MSLVDTGCTISIIRADLVHLDDVRPLDDTDATHANQVDGTSIRFEGNSRRIMLQQGSTKLEVELFMVKNMDSFEDIIIGNDIL